jgi:nicotinamidase-related amidase
MKRNDRWSLVEGSEDAQELADVRRRETDITVIKTRGDSFLRTELEAILRQQNVDTVVIAGYSTNRCVGVTALEACERDFDVLVSGDATMGAEPGRASTMLSVLWNEFGIEPVSNMRLLEQVTRSDGQ